MRKKVVAGNWKMNTLPAEGKALAIEVAEKAALVPEDVQLIIAPPFTHLCGVQKAVGETRVCVAAQNCADKVSGAYTGEISAAMLEALGLKYCILGHSERRQYYAETDARLVDKVALCLERGISPIFCVGENLEEREAGKHFDVVGEQVKNVLFTLTPEQMANVIIAYEPVWAIGTGKTATAEQAQEIHAFIRSVVAEKFGELAEEITILYGGSCKPSNAKELFACPDIDGGLIGGAALKADDFIAIAQSY